MGMFDSYEPVPALDCPACGSTCGAKGRDEWQGKCGPCELLIWTQGKRLAVSPHQRFGKEEMLGFSLPEEFSIYTNCPTCNVWIDAVGECRCGAWAETNITGFGRYPEYTNLREAT